MAQEQDLPPAESGAIEHTDTRIVCPAPSARAGAAAVVNLTLSLNAAQDATELVAQLRAALRDAQAAAAPRRRGETFSVYIYRVLK